MNKDYPKYYEHIREFMGKLGEGIPATMSGFAQLHKTSVSDGALSNKVKELIALGIAVRLGCDACIAFHVRGALDAGATREEIVESIGVAVMMGGAPAVAYGCGALEALEQFEALKSH